MNKYGQLDFDESRKEEQKKRILALKEDMIKLRSAENKKKKPKEQSKQPKI